MAEESEEAFLEFWEVPSWDPRRDRPGIYGFREYGPPERRVQVILLDTRRFRSSLRRGNEAEAGRYEGPYRQIEDPEATLLGEAQWRWLEDTLLRPAAVRIIASSIQVLPEHHGWESWANFPLEQERLFRLLVEGGGASAGDAPPAGDAGSKAGAAGAEAHGVGDLPGKVIVVSGDRHFAEMSRRTVEVDGQTLELLEVTSSGINRGYPPGVPLTENRYRLGEGIRANNFGELSLRWNERGKPVIEATVLTAEDEIVLREQL